MKRVLKLSTCSLFLLCLVSPVFAQSVPSNVPFSDVLEASAAVQTRVYHYGEQDEQLVEVIEPAKKPKANVVFIHGGCWLADYGVDHSRALLSAIAANGYRAIAPEYTRISDGASPWPTMKHDLQQAVHWVLNRYPEEAVWLVGHSAGGHLALLLAPDFHHEVSGVIGLAPIVDLAAYAQVDNGCAVATSSLVPVGVSSAEFYEQFSPVNREQHANTQVFRGAADVIVEQSQVSELFVTQTVDDAGHFDFIMPNTRAFNAWVSWLEEQQ